MHTFLFSCTYILQKKYSVSRQDNIMVSYHIIVANVYRNTMPINPLQIPSKYKTHSLHFYVYTLIFSCIYALIFSNTYLMHTRCRKKFCRLGGLNPSDFLPPAPLSASGFIQTLLATLPNKKIFSRPGAVGAG